MITGILIGLGIAAFIWLIWFIAPLGDPETGVGAYERTCSRCRGRGVTPLRDGSNGPPTFERPLPPPYPPPPSSI